MIGTYKKMVCTLMACLVWGQIHASEILEVYNGSDFGSGSSVAPGPMVLDSKGNLFFIAGQRAILRADSSGGLAQVFIPEITLPNGFLAVRAITIDHKDNLYVVGRRPAENRLEPDVDMAVQITPEGDIAEIFSSDAMREITIRLVTDIAVDQDGNIFLSGYLSDNLIRIDVNGSVTELLAGPWLPEDIPFSRPTELLVDSDNNLYITAQSTIVKLAPDGEIQEVFYGGAPGDNNRFSPVSVAINQYDEVFISGGYADGALIISPDGNVSQAIDASGDGTGIIVQDSLMGHMGFGLEFIGEPLLGPSKAAAGSDGSFYVIGLYSDNLFKVNRNGTVQALLGRSVTPDCSVEDPQFVLATPTNEIFVSARSSGNIVKVKIEDSANANEPTPLVSITNAFNEFPGSAIDPVQRFYNIRDNAFFYTSSAEETEIVRNNSSPEQADANRWPYVYQGSTFGVARSYPGSVPLHRFYNYQTGHHFFTVNESEVEFVMQQVRDNGWPFNYEGVAFSVYKEDPTKNYHGKEIAVLRFYSHTFNRHFYTANLSEASVLRRDQNWVYEGIVFYGEDL